MIATATSIPVTPKRAAAVELAVLAGFSAFLFFFGLGSFGLVGADEPRYAQIAREMLARHDWITPILNGVPWLEKPPLYYWSAMLSYKIFGVSDWAARVPAALLATAMLAAIYFFLRRSRPGSQLEGALITASCAGVIGFARGASTDMPLAATYTAGMLAWFTWRETGRRAWLAAFYVLVALGTLAKGPVAPVLSGVTIALFAFLWRGSETHDTRWRLIARTLWWPGILLFCAVALPWYIAAQIKTPEFFRVFILEHNLERFGTDLYRHQQPLWYYGPVLLLALVPWVVYVVTSIVLAVKTRAGDDDGWRPFLLLWIAAPVMFFSVSQSKLPGYILPAVPAAALLLADWVSSKARAGERGSLVLTSLHAAVGGALVSAVLLAPYRIVRQPASREALTIAAAVGIIIFAAMLVTLRRRGLPLLRFVTLVPVVLALAFVVRVAAPILDARLSARPVAGELARIETRRSPVAVFQVPRELEYGLTFYRDQPVQRYERGEIPPGDHFVIAPAGSLAQVQARLPDRRVSRVGEFSAQKLEIFWISPGMHRHPVSP